MLRLECSCGSAVLTVIQCLPTDLFLTSEERSHAHKHQKVFVDFPLGVGAVLEHVKEKQVLQIYWWR